MIRFFPYPVLVLVLILMWLVLNGLSLGQFLLSIMIAIFAARVMAALEPSKPHIRCWSSLLVLVSRIFVDMIRSNIDVAIIILLKARKVRSGFIVVPLDMRDKTGLAVLACVIACTPGTAWISYDATNSELLIHVLNIKNEQYWRDQIKERYEQPLLEIFE